MTKLGEKYFKLAGLLLCQIGEAIEAKSNIHINPKTWNDLQKIKNQLENEEKFTAEKFELLVLRLTEYTKTGRPEQVLRLLDTLFKKDRPN